MTSIPAALRSGSAPLTMTWDFDNRLSSADVDNDSVTDVSYEFDALGRRVARDDGTTTTVFVPSDQQTIADYILGTVSSSPTYTYVYASYIDEPVLRGGTGGLRYYHRNQQYSITALTNGSGGIEERYAYSAYGEPTITDGSGTLRTTSAENNRYTYTGREWDEELELYHYRARMYDAESGRFLGRDPIGFESNDTNIYRYVRSSPVLLVDPSGLVSPSYDPRSPQHPIWPGGPIPADLDPRPDLGPEVWPTEIGDEAERRRGCTGNDNAHHCWATCMTGSVATPVVNIFIVIISNITELTEAGYIPGDSERDCDANWEGFWNADLVHYWLTNQAAAHCDSKCRSFPCRPRKTD